MTDQRRALLTEREREILSGDADVTDNYRYSIESRIRTRLRERLPADIEVIRDHYPEIFDELLYAAVCEPSGDVAADEPPAEEAQPAGSDDPPSEATAPAGPYDGVEFPATVDRESATAAADAAVAYLQREGAASMRDIVREVMPEHPLGYDVPDLQPGERYRGSWWRKVVKPCLEAHPDVQKPAFGDSEWRHK